MRAVVLASCLFAWGCSSAVEAEAGWETLIALETDAKLGGCVVADLDPSLPGKEIAVVASTGAAYMVSHGEGGFVVEAICQLPGEMIQVAAGDLDPDHPGDELILVGAKQGGEDDGGPGVAVHAWREADGWRHQVVLEDEKLLHGVAIGELDPGHAGAEVMVAGYTHNAHLLGLSAGGWRKLAQVDVGAKAKGVAVGLGGAVVANEDGSLVALSLGEDGWACRPLARCPAPLARVTATAEEVLFCSNDGALRRHRDGETTELYRSPDRLRGAVMLEATDGSPSRQRLATASYTGEVVVLNDGEAEVVARDDGKFHHLTSGELPGLGSCLVGCGYSGRVLVIRMR